jgi:hypothetical protein
MGVVELHELIERVIEVAGDGRITVAALAAVVALVLVDSLEAPKDIVIVCDRVVVGIVDVDRQALVVSLSCCDG